MNKLIKDIATYFFRWWWDEKGNNTSDGFDKWAKTDGKQYIDKLLVIDKRNKQLLTALRLAKGVIKTLHNKVNGNMGKHFWDDFQDIPIMQRINKALKDGKA